MSTLTVNIDDQTLAGERFIEFLKTLSFVSIVSQKSRTKSGLELALEDVERGRVYKAKSVADLMRKTAK